MLQKPLTVALLLVAVCACSQTPPKGSGAVEHVPLAAFVEGLKTVNVTINGQKMNMIFDTGAGMVVLTSDAAARAGCRIYDDATGYRSDGRRLDLKICSSILVQIGSASARIPSAIVGDYFGDPSPVDGMMSLQALADVPFELDLARNEIILHPGADGADVSRQGHWQSVSVQLERQVAGLALDMFLGLQVDGNNLWVEFDTGSSEPLMLRPSAATALGLSGKDGTIEVSLSDEVKLPVHAALREQMIYDGLLGAPDISKYRWLIDLRDHRAWISVN